MTYLDLFSGIGGFSEGFRRAGWQFDKHYFSEINPYAIKIYQRHFPDAIPLGSITGIRPEQLGKVDVITFGFPCQDLSIAGKRAGIEGSRSGLFFEATRLIRYLKPSIFIFENVAGLLTSNDGKDFEVVLREIADIGLYECEWQLLNTSWFLPQNRERVYFIGHLGERGGRKVFPIGEADGEGYRGGQNELICVANYVPSGHEAGNVFDTAGIAPTVKNNHGTVTAIMQINNPKHSNDRVYGQGGGNFKSDGTSFTLPATHMSPGVTQGSRIRRLTEVECERLQGFPDGWTEGVSSSQRYRALGNAVTVDVVYEIAKRLK